MTRSRTIWVLIVLTLACTVLAACLARQDETAREPLDNRTDGDWKALADYRSDLADVLADPQASVSAGTTIAYTYEGEAALTCPLDSDQVLDVLEALDAIEVGGPSEMRWDDYGDAFAITSPDGRTQYLSFEGHAAIVDAEDPRKAFEIRNADRLWSITHELVRQQTEE